MSGASCFSIAADVSAALAKEGRSAEPRKPQPGQPGGNENGPRKEQEGHRLGHKPNEKPCANNNPSQRLTRQEEQQAVRWIENLSNLAHPHAALCAAKPWPWHWVGDVLDVHVTPNV